MDICTSKKLIENVEISLGDCMICDSGLLNPICNIKPSEKQISSCNKRRILSLDSRIPQLCCLRLKVTELTVCNSTTSGITLEVKTDLDVFALQERC